ncbi:MAG: ribosome recycling factor [Patescibacteria group bacterium]|nr:ribosome recycling factor [Patescibacteria group bacterium]
MNITESHQEEFTKTIDFLKKDIQSVRTNRANPELINHILIEVYGTKTPLEQLATLSVPEPRTIVIQPWDKNIIKEIEKSLSKSDVGAPPMVNEGVIRLTLPPLNEERRKDLVKILHLKLESARKSLRAIRDSIKEEIVKSERSKEISEDDKYRLFEKLDKMAGDYQEEVKLIGERKEKEIISI